MRSAFVAALGVAAIVAPHAAMAAYPERPIRFIVPAAAGNSGDISSRLIVAQLSKLFKAMTGTNMIHVPFRGSAIAITDLTAGRVSVMFDNIPSIGPHAKAGRVRGLAVTTAKRVPAYQELPTVAEAGVPGYEVTGWGGLIAPGGTPKSIVARLNAETNEALALPDLKDKLTSLGSELAGGTPEQFTELIRKETIKWGDVVKRAGIKID